MCYGKSVKGTKMSLIEKLKKTKKQTSSFVRVFLAIGALLALYSEAQGAEKSRNHDGKSPVVKTVENKTMKEYWENGILKCERVPGNRETESIEKRYNKDGTLQFKTYMWKNEPLVITEYDKNGEEKIKISDYYEKNVLLNNSTYRSCRVAAKIDDIYNKYVKEFRSIELDKIGQGAAKFDVDRDHDNKCREITEFDENGFEKNNIEIGPHNTVYVTSYLPNGGIDRNGGNGLRDISIEKLYNEYVLKSKPIDTASLPIPDSFKKGLIVSERAKRLGISLSQLGSTDLEELLNKKNLSFHLQYYIEHNLRGNSVDIRGNSAIDNLRGNSVDIRGNSVDVINGVDR